MELDQIDKKILRELQKDADRSNAMLAEKVGLSPSACLRRIARLKKEGVIKRTVAVLDGQKLGHHLTAIVTVEFVRHAPEYKRDFINRVKKDPAVSQCYLVTGDISYVIVVNVATMEDYTKLSERLFDHDANVEVFYTHVVMQTIKFDTGIVID